MPKKSRELAELRSLLASVPNAALCATRKRAKITPRAMLACPAVGHVEAFPPGEVFELGKCVDCNRPLWVHVDAFDRLNHEPARVMLLCKPCALRWLTPKSTPPPRRTQMTFRFAGPNPDAETEMMVRAGWRSWLPAKKTDPATP